MNNALNPSQQVKCTYYDVELPLWTANDSKLTIQVKIGIQMKIDNFL